MAERDELEFWRARWREGRIGFHEGKPNAFLERHVARLTPGRRVLVPLCGKTEDLAFLAGNGHRVVGVEGVVEAARAFFTEHGLQAEEETIGGLLRLAAGGVEIWAADFFALGPSHLGTVDALYDRAALIALPPETRVSYAARVRSLLPKGAPGLIVTFEYDQTKMSGPPFSVEESEVQRLFDGAQLERLGEREESRFAASGVQAKERCFFVVL